MKKNVSPYVSIEFLNYTCTLSRQIFENCYGDNQITRLKKITRRAASGEISGTRYCLEIFCTTKKEVSDEPTVERVST